MKKFIFSLATLLISAQIASAASVTVNITDNCVGELGMQVYRGGAIGGPWALLTNPDLPPNTTSYQDLAAPIGRSWYFVRCIAGSETLDSLAVSILINQMSGTAPTITLSQP